MRKKSKLSPDELSVFEHAMQGTKPLAQRKVRLAVPKVKIARKLSLEEEKSSFFDGGEPRDLIQADDSIAFNREGVPHKTLRKLSKGQYNVEAVLDLHRQTIEEARLAVNHFLHECLENGDRCILIVHGKGRPDTAPVLKNQINHWLRQAKPVLAFCSATPKHGGQGAVYVLLKGRTEEKFV
jgi:DNA-nicking Smr family endonuclease